MVVVIKYNAGNIHSVVHALRRIGVDPVVTDNKELSQQAVRFFSRMKKLQRQRLILIESEQIWEWFSNISIFSHI